MLIAIRNLLFQPLSLEINGDGGSMHLCSRERKTIGKDQISQEIQSAAYRGIVSLTEIPGSTQPDSRDKMVDGEHAVETAKSKKRGQ